MFDISSFTSCLNSSRLRLSGSPFFPECQWKVLTMVSMACSICDIEGCLSCSLSAYWRSKCACKGMVCLASLVLSLASIGQGREGTYTIKGRTGCHSVGNHPVTQARRLNFRQCRECQIKKNYSQKLSESWRKPQSCQGKQGRKNLVGYLEERQEEEEKKKLGGSLLPREAELAYQSWGVT